MPPTPPRKLSPFAFAVPPFLDGFSPLLRGTPQLTAVRNSTPTEHDCLGVQTKPSVYYQAEKTGKNRSQ
jgi:hypothetical protein